MNADIFGMVLVQHVDRQPALVEHVRPADVLDLKLRRLPPELASRFKFAKQKSKLAGTIRGSFFVIKGEY